jgi:membrane associated rhomboid family serine protease
VVKWLLIVTIGVFLVQDMADRAISGAPFTHALGLSLNGIQSGRLWQVVTYMFLHGPWFHLLLNMFLLFMIGPETERGMGSHQFFVLYFVSGILGGLGWLIISAARHPGALCVGASGAIFGIIGAFAALYPQRDVTILLFFIIPLRLKAWMLGVGLGALELLFLVSHPEGTVANAAHLAGGLAGYVYTREMSRRDHIGRSAWRWPNLRRLPSLRFPKADEGPDDPGEIDRILEKMHRQGIRSLTADERKSLERKSKRLRGE